MSDVKKRSKNNITNESKSDVNTSVTVNTKSNRNIPLRVLSRIVVIASLLIVVYFSSKDENFRTFARQSDTLTGKGQIVACSPGYLSEINKFEGCTPKDCGRFVTDQVISDKEATKLIELAKKGFELGRSSGGASIFDLDSGSLSYGQHFINVFKKGDAKTLFTEEDFTIYKTVVKKIKYAVSYHFGVNPDKLHLTHPSFFSEITARKAVTLHDEYWHPHIDKETYKSFHYTTLLYLNDYNVDFKGGRFVFVDNRVNNTVEPKKARLSMFTSGSENLHYVEKVSTGVRYAITIAFTCDKQHAKKD